MPWDVGKTYIFAFSEDTYLEKERMRSKVISRKVGVGLKRRQKLSKRRLGWMLAWWGSTEKKEASHFLGLKKRHQYSDQRSNRNRAPCVASTTVGAEREEDQMARLHCATKKYDPKVTLTKPSVLDGIWAADSESELRFAPSRQDFKLFAFF